MTDPSARRLTWRRRGPAPADEHCTVVRHGTGLSLTGLVVGAEDGVPVRVEYSVRTDGAGFTTEVHVVDLRGSRSRAVDLARDARGGWTVDGGHAPALEGCTDVDLGCSPSTNALPIRRLGLRVGESSTIQVAWLRFPELTVARTTQTYARLDASRYRYASGDFESELTVDDEGFVIEYDEWWRPGVSAPGRASR